MKNLEIGKRYWLDEEKDCSGVLSHYDNMGDPRFSDVEGKKKYGELSDGTVAFALDDFDYQEVDSNEFREVGV